MVLFVGFYLEFLHIARDFFSISVSGLRYFSFLGPERKMGCYETFPYALLHVTNIIICYLVALAVWFVIFLEACLYI